MKTSNDIQVKNVKTTGPIASQVTMLSRVAGAPPVQSLLLQGYDQFADATRPTLVIGEMDAGAPEFGMKYSVCTTTEEVYTGFDVSTSLAYSGINGSVDAKAKFMNSLSISRTGVYVVVYVYCVLNKWTTDKVVLPSTFTPPANTDDGINSFYSTYGNAYISSVSMGGWYAAVYSFQCSTIEEQTEFTGTLSGAGISGSGGSFSADVATYLVNQWKNTSVAISFTQQGEGVTAAWPGPEGLFAFAQNFQQNVDANFPAVLDFACTSYRHLDAMPGNFVEMDKLYFDFNMKKDSYCATLAKAIALQNWLINANAIFTLYGYGGDKDLSAKLVDIANDVETISDFLVGITYGPLPIQPFPTKELAFPVWGYPSLSIGQGVADLGSGGKPGDHFISDVSIFNVSNQTYIAGLSSKYGDTIDSLTVSFCSSDKSWSSQYGSNSGDNFNDMTFQTNERIVSISTQVDETTNYITLMTSLGQPFTVSGGNYSGSTNNSWTEADNTRIIGFKGSWGWYVNQLQVLYAVFSPILWSIQAKP